MKLGETLERWFGKRKFPTKAPETKRVCEELGLEVSPVCVEMLASHGLSQEEIVEFIRAANVLDCHDIVDIDHEIDRMYAIKILQKHGFSSFEHYQAEMKAYESRH